MENQNESKISNMYLISVLLLMLLLPGIFVAVTYYAGNSAQSFMSLVGKWFVFWGIGGRLLTAGIRQVTKPAFTAEEIFHLKEKASHVVVKELGFANICLASIALVSLYLPHWRMAAAVSGGLFFGIAGINHLIKKPVSPNEWVAMVSDIFIALVMLAYMFSMGIQGF